MFTSAISGIIVSVTSCGKQGNMSRRTLSDRIEIEAGIFTPQNAMHIYILPQCSMAAARVLNLARNTQFNDMTGRKAAE